MIQKLPQRFAVCWKRLCLCSVPQKAGGGGQQWTTCQIAYAPPRESWPGKGGGDTGDTSPRDLRKVPTS